MKKVKLRVIDYRMNSEMLDNKGSISHTININALVLDGNQYACTQEQAVQLIRLLTSGEVWVTDQEPQP